MKYIISILFLLVLSCKTYALDPHILEWPLKIETNQIWLGDSLSQYVGNDEHGYLHGGCDLVVPAGTEILTPLAGIVEFYFYKVEHSESGKISFLRLPFVDSQELFSKYELTTEVRITSPSGVQVLFHHVDPKSIPLSLREKSKLKIPIEQNSIVGRVAKWPILKRDHDYSHVHYILTSPTGKELNCQYYSVPLADHKVPKILEVLAVNESGNLQEIKSDQTLFKPNQIIVVAEDQTDFSPFIQPPTRIGITVGKSKFEWDFREGLENQSSGPVSIKDLYYFQNENLNQEMNTVSDYWTTRHSIRLEVPSGKGPFTIFAEDGYGNRTVFSGIFK